MHGPKGPCNPGHDRHKSVANSAGNTRNGKSKKPLKGEFGELPIEVPRERHGSFEPQLIPKHQTRCNGFDDKIISLYARGMTVREIQAHLQEMYGAEVSPSLITSVTDPVSEEVKVWQAWPLDPIYPIVYLNCIHVKVREGAVRVKEVVADLRHIYQAATSYEVEQRLGEFETAGTRNTCPLARAGGATGIG